MAQKRRAFRGWGPLNEERLKLINKKHGGGGLTPDEEARLEMLQAIATAVMNYVAVPAPSQAALEKALRDGADGAKALAERLKPTRGCDECGAFY